MFRDRSEAGALLGAALQYLKVLNPVVVAIPRGGLPVGAALASALEAPLDIVLTKKIGHPLNKEFAIGAVGLEQLILEKPEVASRTYLEDEISRLRSTLKSRHALFYDTLKPLPLSERTVILTDDGIATGNTLKAAVKLIASKHPAKLIIAIPVAPAASVRQLEELHEIDEVICLEQPEDFGSVGQYYQFFPQIIDDEAVAILKENRSRYPA